MTLAYTAPAPGVYTPAVTFFDPETDSLCLEEQAKLYSYLASTGLAGLVVLGTNAETFLLTREERQQLLQTARSAVPQGYPIIAGCGGHSTAQVIEYINDAARAGSDYALVLPCAYFGKQTTPAVIKAFYNKVAKASPIPILIYNFPAVCNGVDLDSEIITDIANANPNVVGVKLTCASVGKITRLAATFPAERFAVFGGQADFLLGGLASGSIGCIAAFGNVFPKVTVKVFNLWCDGRHKEALELHQKAAIAESLIKAGIAATKYATAIFTAPKAGIDVDKATYLLRPRHPYEEPPETAKALIQKRMHDLDEIEQSL